MKFIALDVETACSDIASICQIGIAVFEEGVMTDSWMTYVNPQCGFQPMNIRIHGIRPEHVKDAPTFAEIHGQLCRLLKDCPTIQHSNFDRNAIHRACDLAGLPYPEARWLDTVLVARRAWPEQKSSGYGLQKMSALLGITFRHHDALEDARAAGMIMAAAIARTGIPLEDWFARLLQPVQPKTGWRKPRTDRRKSFGKSGFTE